MSVRLRALVGTILLALVFVPAAEAAKRGKLTMRSFKLSDNSVTAGNTFRASGKVRARKNRRATTGRVTYSLDRNRSERGGRRLGADNIKRTRAGRTRKFSERLRIGRNVAPREYFLIACVRRGSGAGKASCKRRKMTVNPRPQPGAPPATTPPGPPATTPPTTTPPDNRSAAAKLRDGVTFDGMFEHLRAFQDIANANGGNRASGNPGYDASAQYVAERMGAAGLTVSTFEFDFVLFSENSDPVFQRTAPTAQTYAEYDAQGNGDFSTMSYSDSGDVTAQLETVPTTGTGNGCTATDFATFPAGQVALIERGACPFAQKATNAQDAGAAAVVIYNNAAGPLNGTLGETAQDGEPDPPDVTIPAVGTIQSVGQALATEDSDDDVSVRVRVDAVNDERTTTNVFGDTTGGDPNNIIIVGAHLDSVEEGAGINDNGSGSAFNLELAEQFTQQGIAPANRVRFAFWGAEESGLVGSTKYVQAVSDEEFSTFRMNLNFDMMASPNFARLIYDGDFSDTAPPATAPVVNPGAVEIEQDFEDYFTSVGLASEPTDFSGRSDYKPFQDNGVATGGLFTGAEGIKTAAQRDKFGGIANVAFDPNYHQAGDDLGNINRTGFEQMTDAAAFVAGTFATDPGMPARFQQIDPTPRRSPRTSKRLGDSFQR